MKIKNISYISPPSDLINDCLDVIVSLDDENCNNGFAYVVEVTTPQCLGADMEESQSKFLEPSYPVIIVSKLTHEIIEAAIESFVNTTEDSFWLKLYHTTFALEIEDLNEIIKKKKKEVEAKLDIDQ